MRFWFYFLLFFVSTGSAQLTIRGPQPIYNGQNVAAVDLVGNPHRDVTPLLPLVAQKAGQPYSQENVEKSIHALQATGQFEKVQVSVVPDLNGLRLNFLLEPAFYLGMVKFPGTSKTFSYTRLLQVANLSDEDPFVPARLPISERALLDFFHHAGYFDAKVHTTFEIDDPHELVGVDFSVDLGKRARIGTVTIQGVEDGENARLAHSVRSLRARFTGGLLKHGKSYTPSRISAATALIKRTLSQQHHLASKVQELPPQYHPESRLVDVAFKVEEGPTVIIKATGARLSLLPFMSSRQMKKLIPIYSEGTVDGDLVQEGQRNLVDYFQRKGYFDAKVKTDLQRNPDRITLVYQIEKGKKHKVDRIAFQGNHELSEKDLLAQVVVKRGHLWSHGSFSEKLMKQSAKNIEALYRDHGFEDVKVNPQAIDHEPRIEVNFTVQEGTQTLVNNVQVTGNDN